MDKQEALASYIRQLVVGFLDSGKQTRTKASLARKSGVHVGVIQRLVDESCKTIMEGNAYALLSFFEGHKAAASKMKESYDNWQAPFSISAIQGESQMIDGSKVDWDEFTNRILDLASSEEGVSKESILRLYGEEAGLRKAQILIDAGLLKEVNGAYKTSRVYTEPNPRSVLKRIEADIRSFDHSRFGEGPFFQRFSGLYSEKAVNDMKEAFRAYMALLLKIDDEDSARKTPKNTYVKIAAVGDYKKIEES